MRQGSVYFPNLNALRFIAAMMVLVHHIEQYKSIYNIDSLWLYDPIQNMGRLGVALFFVLSGFLITTLLLDEKGYTGTISIKKFYMRRILRIWPLYFLIVGLSLFVIPYINFLKVPISDVQVLHQNFFQKIILFTFFLPNMAIIAYAPVAFCSQTWSIGVEEQFYLLWPTVMKYVKNKFVFSVVFIVIFLAIKYTLLQLRVHQPKFFISRYLDVFPIDCMLIGGLFAFIGYDKRKVFVAIKQIFFNKYLQYVVFTLTVYFLIRGYNFQFFQLEVYSLLFGIIIFNLALNKDRIINLEYKWLDYMGKISYGLYIYQVIAIIIVMNTLLRFNVFNNVVLYVLTIAITIVLAALSYRFFEKPFVAKKLKFSVLVSGDNAKE
jgi:peptidoglycan/LPS O-acetylase OafA/YrhL